jgi:CAAX prenyl protease-like protein
LADPQRTSTGAISNRDLILPYLAPYGAYVLIGTLAGPLGRELDYILRLVATATLLLAFRARYARVTGPRSWKASVLIGVPAGVGAALVWVGLLLPFQDFRTGETFDAPAFLLRTAAATLVVPFAEELLCRGYILRLITQWQQARAAGRSIHDVLDYESVHEIQPGAWTPLAVVVSSAAFALGHSPPQMLAAFGFGVVMSCLWIGRRDLVAPISAHAVTNLVLYIYVFETGSWGLW